MRYHLLGAIRPDDMAEQPETTGAEAAWDRQALRDPHKRPDKSRRVQQMFNAIAPTYERVNSVASLGQDARWRRRTIKLAAPQPGDEVLDICCGTGDMIRESARQQPAIKRIVGLDFAQEMLDRGDYQGVAPPVTLLCGDALALPFEDASFDITCCAFGVRNFQNLQQGLGEMARVLRHGGRCLILEFATPENPLFRWGYHAYTNVVLPTLGTLISGDRSAYRYLPRSIETFESRRSMLTRLEDAGFTDLKSVQMNLGSVIIYRGVKAAR
jgi:demethylmenaquinone methyltransferase/2-methoxy-6-polyprenyl-1,4-benzoquinol methylase